MNLPNKLTVLRIALAFIFMTLLFVDGMPARIAALFIFLSASLTDALDGYVAKKNNQVTDFGKLMDPIADKILVLAAFLAFVQMGIIQAWMVVIIIFREIAVTSLRILALSKGKVLQAETGGKHKTVWQLFTILAIMIFIILRTGGKDVFKFWTTGAEATYKDAIFFVMLFTVALTLTSGLSYLLKNREVYSNEKTR